MNLVTLKATAEHDLC